MPPIGENGPGLQSLVLMSDVFFFACSALRQVPMTMAPSDLALCSSLQFLVTDLLVLLLHK